MKAHKFKNKIWACVIAGFFPVITHAQISILEPTSKDKSVEYIGYIFGGVVSVITGAESPTEIDSVLGAMSAVLCAGMLLATGGIIMYSLITGLLDTANEGNPLGKSLSTMWVPLRMVLAMGLVLPLGAGYSVMQVAVLWIAGQGIGLADSVWTASIKHIQSTGTLVTPPLRGDLETIADSILLSRVCLHSTNHILRNVTVIGRPTVQTISPPASFGGPAASLVPDFARPAGYLEALQNYDSKYGPVEATALSLASRLSRNKSEGEFRSLGSNPCGQIRLKFPVVDAGSPIASEVMDFQTSMIDAFAELDVELDPLARDIVNSVSDPDFENASPDMYSNISESFKSEYATIVQTAMSAIATQRSDDWAQSGPENAMTSVGSLDAGWITAGAWYWDIVKINRETQALTAVDIAYSAPTMQAYSLPEMGHYMQALANYHQVKIVSLDNGETVEARARSSYSSESSQSGALLDGLEFLLRQASASPDPVSMLAAGAATLSGTLVGAITTAQVTATAACGLAGSGNSIPVLGFFIDAAAGVTCYAAEWTRNFGLMAAAGTLPILLFFGIYLPAVPLILWVMAAAGWFVLVIEAVVAAPIWAASHAMPEGNGFVGQRAQAGYMVILSLFLRPTLMLFGFFASMLLSLVMVKLLMVLFVPFLSTRVGSDTTAVVWTLAGLFIFALILAKVTHKAFGLIHEIPDKVLRYIGGGQENLGEAHGEEGAKGVFVAGVAKMSGGVGSVAGKAGKAAGAGAGGTVGGLTDGGEQKEKRNDSQTAKVNKDLSTSP